MIALSIVSDQFSRQYAGILAAVSGLFARALDDKDPTTARARSDFARALRQVRDAYVTDFTSHIQTITERFKVMALETGALSLNERDMKLLDEHLSDGIAELVETIGSCVARDCGSAQHDLKDIALRVDLLRSGANMTKVRALYSATRGSVGRLTFAHSDRLGRRHTSDSFVRLLVRRHLLMTLVETTLFAIAKGGSDLARVEHPGGVSGEIFSITGATKGYPSYDDLRDTVFHPNSDARVVKE